MNWKPPGLRVLWLDLPCGCHVSTQVAEEAWYASSLITWCQLDAPEEHVTGVENILSGLKETL